MQVFKLLVLCLVIGAGVIVSRHGVPRSLDDVQGIVEQMPVIGRKAMPLETVTLEQAYAALRPTIGTPTVTLVYMANSPANLFLTELRPFIERWEERGVKVLAFSIDHPDHRERVPKFVRNSRLNAEPVWINMPGGDQCVFEQMKAVQRLGLKDKENLYYFAAIFRNRGGSVVASRGVANGERIESATGNFTTFAHDVNRFLASN